MESVENVLPEGVKLEDVLSVLKVAVAGIGLISALSAFSLSQSVIDRPDFGESGLFFVYVPEQSVNFSATSAQSGHFDPNKRPVC